METSTQAYLRSKYAIVGVGETPYVRGSGRTHRAMAQEAIGKAIADAGLERSALDGMLSSSSGTPPHRPWWRPTRACA